MEGDYYENKEYKSQLENFHGSSRALGGDTSKPDIEFSLIYFLINSLLPIGKIQGKKIGVSCMSIFKNNSLLIDS